MIKMNAPLVQLWRTLEWKLVHYPGAKHGELYDLKNDSHELFNLWADPKYAAQRAEMAGLLADWLIRSQDQRLGPVRDSSERADAVCPFRHFEGDSFGRAPNST
jgi:hypothetical protein